MEKIYKVRKYRIIFNLFLDILVSGFIWLLSGIWLEPPLTYGIGVATFLLYYWLVIGSNMITIHVNGNELTIKKKRKVKHHFYIDQCNFSAQTRSSGGDTECTLYVTPPNGNEVSIDCELIGINQFSSLIEDLGIVGDNAEAIEIITTKKESAK